jgi:pimeloyl-ACP methyl ester carboxylesterase
VPASAARLRSNLREALAEFDPAGADPALGQMVLVGHSMGGLVAKMTAQDTGLALWDAVFTRPPDEVRVPSEERAELLDALIFRPLPFVRRLVFIATPHRGSRAANAFIGRFFGSFIKENDPLDRAVFEAIRENGRGVLRWGNRPHRLNGIGSLRPNDPVLRADAELPVAPWVTYHSIIPQLGVDGVTVPHDGLVPYWSSHIDGAASERVTRGYHLSHDSPEVTAELRRILHEHLAAVDAGGVGVP